MDYEKAYKEVIDRAKANYNTRATEGEKAMLENIFPELKESEDEKIMKKPDCAYYDGGYCRKGLPGTPCEIIGCVAYIPIPKTTEPCKVLNHSFGAIILTDNVINLGYEQTC